jgi:hypothetical protein
MKKQTVIYILLVFAMFIIFTGCGKTVTPIAPETIASIAPETVAPISPGIVALTGPPFLEIVFTSDDGTSTSIQALMLGTNWLYIDEEGNQKGVLADSPVPWEFNYDDDRTLNLNGSGGEAKMLFEDDNFLPDTMSVNRLDAIYLFSRQENIYENYETVLLNDNRFRLDSDGQDFIYMIDAKWDAKGLIWSESRTTYCFRVNS